MIDVSVKRVHGASPLRYPGGKSALSDFLSGTIQSLGLETPTYVEPYAGGAGAAIALLDRGIVSDIVINDFDPAIFAFWDAVVNHNEEFLDLFDSIEVTLDEWKRQKEIYRSGSANDTLTLGFATYFLNRTNRSGVLNAGVIGGQKQDGTYTVSARFNKSALRPRLKWLGNVAENIAVTQRDGLNCIADHLHQDNSLIYADPPYFEKGSYLYLNAFEQQDHEDLAQLLNSRPDAHWILSYDNVPEIRDLYMERFQQTFQLNYSAHRTGKTSELLVASVPVVNALYERQLLLGA